jgi:UDP-GlcNAc3NAcA epimerase
MKLCTIVGARPQFIKAATVSRVIASQSHIQEVIVHTGQHYDANMSDQFFEELNIPTPTYPLAVGSGLHGEQTGTMLTKIEAVLLLEAPDWVLVYGDTNSTLAGALAAAKLHIPVAHVEAGLRSFNRKMPEEINRIVADHLGTVLFTPTDHGYQQLLKEGIPPEKIHNVGDVMYDATLYYNERNAQRQTLVDAFNLQGQAYTLATIHRAENTDCDQRLTHIVNALLELSAKMPVILPLHPRTVVSLDRLNLLDALKKQVRVIEPVGYLDMLALEQHATCIVTDSGGVQKEAYFNRVPCITLRDETEWVELVELGWNTLCSPNEPFSLLPIMSASRPSSRESERQLYGNGDAAEKIVHMLSQY